MIKFLRRSPERSNPTHVKLPIEVANILIEAGLIVYDCAARQMGNEPEHYHNAAKAARNCVNRTINGTAK